MIVKRRTKRIKRSFTKEVKAGIKETDWQSIKMELLKKAINKRLTMNSNVSECS